ncbi:SIMPL domain-containing protein [Halorhabdus sp. CUG00001]|uniref:SIMPL domain-containing protein n=1 Tax=Halorhabdus sp. CUG00001 TaxID=2600297 RepID=UPI00131BDA62|nr:SIMPL domain-containing protein [Halorhabdus sp. CUG00001]
MHTNKSLLVVATVAVMLLAAVGVATAVSPVAQTEQPDRQIEVGASGDVSAEADRARLHVGVVATAADATTARNQVAENVTALRATLEELGISDDNIETARYDIDEVRDRAETTATVEYRAVHTFQITLEDPARVGAVVDGVVDSGANRVRGVSFTVSEQRRYELRQDALESAMERARSEAETLAESADLTIEGAASISADDVHVRPYRVEEAMTTTASGDVAASTAIESGPVDVTASVQVVYNATAA